MAGPENMSDMSVVEPNKSLLTEQLDPVLVPDLVTAQATGQGSTLHAHKANTQTLLGVTRESTINNTELLDLWLPLKTACILGFHGPNFGAVCTLEPVGTNF